MLSLLVHTRVELPIGLYEKTIRRSRRSMDVKTNKKGATTNKSNITLFSRCGNEEGLVQ